MVSGVVSSASVDATLVLSSAGVFVSEHEASDDAESSIRPASISVPIVRVIFFIWVSILSELNVGMRWRMKT